MAAAVVSIRWLLAPAASAAVVVTGGRGVAGTVAAMSMPRNLLLIRHGESVGNVVVNAAKAGDESLYTDEFTTTPGHQWRLTDLGREQAAVAGAWVRAQTDLSPSHWLCSPYVRTRETAGNLDLPAGRWRLNRALRERDWGDIGSMLRREFLSLPQYRENARLFLTDPLYWVAPNGESIAHVAEDRVRNVLDTLHRECSGDDVVAVTHGEWMWAARLVLERLDDDEFKALDDDKSERIRNCEVLQYTRVTPGTGQDAVGRDADSATGPVLAPRLRWLRRAWPVVGDDGRMRMTVGPWVEIATERRTNAELLASVAHVPAILTGR